MISKKVLIFCIKEILEITSKTFFLKKKSQSRNSLLRKSEKDSIFLVMKILTDERRVAIDVTCFSPPGAMNFSGQPTTSDVWLPTTLTMILPVTLTIRSSLTVTRRSSLIVAR